MRENNLKAIGIMLAGVAFFAFLDAGLKHLTEDYPSIQVVTLRCWASLPFLLLPLILRGGLGELRIKDPKPYLVRGALGVGVIWGYIYALSVQSLSVTYATYMSAPLLVAALSVPFLKESVPLRRWIAIAVGFVGVLVALDPSGDVNVAGAAAVLFSTICYAFTVIAVRFIGKVDSTSAIVFWHLLMVGVVTGAFAIPEWKAIDEADWGLIAFCGFTGALGQYCFTAAFRAARAAAIVPFEYSAIVWAIGMDFVIFDIDPAAHVLNGALIVIVAGLYVMWDEARSGRAMDLRPDAGAP
jgi:drug/metabolite transporter (DMT)-like permease